MDLRKNLPTVLLHASAYLAWAAIGWDLWSNGAGKPAWLDAPVPPELIGALHLAFLALMASLMSEVVRPGWPQRLVVLGEIAVALAMLAIARNHILPILVTLCVIHLLYAWPARAAVAIIVALNLVVFGIYQSVWELDAPRAYWLTHLSFQAFAGLTVWFGFKAGEARDELAATHADLLATRTLLAESARDGERLRLSRELHDVAGHKLTALKLNLAALVRDPRFAAEAQVALCARLADELLADIRGVVQQMRADEGLELAPAISALASPFPRPRLHLQIDDDARVGSLVQAEALLRTVQEGLTNAARHSQAGNLWVVLRREAGGLRLDIRDDGRGRGELKPGNGLGGMRERLEAAGGGLHVRRTDTGGVHLQAWLPVAA